MSAGHAAIVLAAGGSRRLGRPKQLLTREGETLLHRVVRLASTTAPSRLVVVIGAQAELVTRALVDLEVETVVNPHWDSGRSSSLQCAAQALQAHTGPVLVLGCDQPALEAEHLRQLLDGAARSSSGCAATAYGSGFGMPAVINAALWRSVYELEGEQGFGRRLNALPADAVWRLHAPELQLDIDTPENEQAAIARGLLDPSGLTA
jgi:molybdenum cofactor cytidylyltransferase